MVQLILTVTMAYPLAKRNLRGRQLILSLVVFAMVFSGGMIPTFLLIKDLGLLNSYWALILPAAINPFSLIIIKNFFQELPAELEESAKMDGATEVGILWRILLPLSKPVLATFALFYAVGIWNDFMSPLLYLSRQLQVDPADVPAPGHRLLRPPRHRQRGPELHPARAGHQVRRHRRGHPAHPDLLPLPAKTLRQGHAHRLRQGLTRPENNRKHSMKILLAGDSTVANCPTHEYPMSGWGAQLPRHVYTWAAVHNFAKGGASTESFREEGLWGQLLETAAEGDLVLIQFGHNDQKKVHLAARTGYAANLRTMVADVRALGAVPVLCTSVERRHFLDGPASDAVLEESLEDYPEVVREIALELQLPVVDLNAWTRALYEELGVEESQSLFCHFGPGEHAFWPAGLADNTHFSQRGAALVAEEVAAQLGGSASAQRRGVTAARDELGRKCPAAGLSTTAGRG